MLETALRQEVEALTYRLLATAGDHYHKDPDQVIIQFNLTGKAAGMALFPHRSTPVIRYNTLLLIENQEDFLRRTVPHEVAHVVARRFFGQKIKPHGAEWREVMQLFGAEASRCHNYDISRASRRRLKRFNYRCDCRTHRLSSIRHKRVLQGQQYLCIDCKQPLVASVDPE
ncbi:SprT-like domain-containing protein [Sedimenticola sp.]|uniref:SprT family zinc-dependent metalloprotease n=1 Tax=Sedimenticola sp. TaxID=1940285 RepID=UPI003D0D561E